MISSALLLLVRATPPAADTLSAPAGVDSAAVADSAPSRRGIVDPRLLAPLSSRTSVAAPASAPVWVVPAPTPRRRRATEVSDASATRLRIHKLASYTMIPLFAA